jgi:hypothetical protein
MWRKKDNQNEGLTGEIFRIYCNVIADSTSIGRMMNNTYSCSYENYYVASKHMHKATLLKVSLKFLAVA